MSWEPYLESLVRGGFHHGCIAGHNGSTWAATPSFRVLPKEVKSLEAALGGDAETRLLFEEKGFTIQGRAYALNRIDELDDDMAILIGRCKQHGSASRGVIIARTAKTVIIGLHDPIFAEGISFGKSNVSLHQLAETLTSMNF